MSRPSRSSSPPRWAPWAACTRSCSSTTAAPTAPPRACGPSARPIPGSRRSIFAAAADRPRPCRPASTTPAARSSSPWMATCRTTQLTFKLRLEARRRLRPRVRLAKGSAGSSHQAQFSQPRGQWPHLAHDGRPSPRLRLLAQGLPPRGAGGNRALRGDAPLHSGLRLLERGSDRRGAGDPPRPAAWRFQLWARAGR